MSLCDKALCFVAFFAWLVKREGQSVEFNDFLMQEISEFCKISGTFLDYI
jgi:hypothetical protein